MTKDATTIISTIMRTLPGIMFRNSEIITFDPDTNVITIPLTGTGTIDLDQTGRQWAPFLEWSLPNPDYAGNPFDLSASVTFVHNTSGESRTTEMFYTGGTTWRFRFSATQPGLWSFTTSSEDSDLDNKNGTLSIDPNPDVNGFVTQIGNKWGFFKTRRVS